MIASTSVIFIAHNPFPVFLRHAAAFVTVPYFVVKPAIPVRTGGGRQAGKCGMDGKDRSKPSCNAPHLMTAEKREEQAPPASAF
jgi:hypothetical protein